MIDLALGFANVSFQTGSSWAPPSPAAFAARSKAAVMAASKKLSYIPGCVCTEGAGSLTYQRAGE